MTNAERFIGDEDLIDAFIDEFTEFACSEDIDFKYHFLKETLIRFFKASVKPTLTDDERVILRNISNDEFGKYIGRGDGTRENTPIYYNLYLRGNDESKAYAIGTIYNHLFQFIKERRRIHYRGVAKMIEKLETRTKYGDWAIRQEAPSNFELMEKINEIIDYLNKQEKNNSCRVNWTHQDSITGENIV